MFAKLIVSFILIYLYVCLVLRTSIQSYFTFHVQLFKAFMVEYVLSVLV